ncbi:flagellar assembly protein FliW [Bacillus mesophilus]|uniref:Flagellar assembly factor FliW n=1 Tax=Bacillus mesophilus TaxID=1808955 RepID=A0A6M0Q927_9BACI|nr:flagellar assembly protein FliW [Bacillus mesophilus]NEY72259.1 flagellar assembly protein FliW [Bacillus mesophilus]
MRLETRYHGEQEIDENEIILFEKGIPGFLEEKKFVLLPYSDDSVFFILQSALTAGLAFVIADPFIFFKEYDFTLEDQVVHSLELTAEENVAVYVILTVQDPFQKTTVNLQAPVVINIEKRLGKQVILTGTDYHTKHSIFKEAVK